LAVCQPAFHRVVRLYNKKQVPHAPTSWNDMLNAEFKGRLQYSTPGVAGDGTAVMIKAIHDLGGQAPAMAYLKQLQANNVAPSKSTGALASKVDKGELLAGGWPWPATPA
jgi:2-aminoethylphosphonate transport system substrate-binding protein